MSYELKAARAKAELLATHDFLTGLSNRVLWQDRITHALARRQHEMLAVLTVDIDDFKKINDTYGHSEGDRLLASSRRTLGLGSETIEPACSLGIALYPAHGTTPEALMVNLDRALYAAKKRGKSCYAFFAREGGTRLPDSFSPA